MPRYYFHFRSGSSIFEDDLGEEFADAAAALQQAKRIALELARAGEPMNSVIVVAGGDRQLFEVPLSEHGNEDGCAPYARASAQPLTDGARHVGHVT